MGVFRGSACQSWSLCHVFIVSCILAASSVKAEGVEADEAETAVAAEKQEEEVQKEGQGEEEEDGGGQDPAATASIINLFGMLSFSDFFHGPYERSYTVLVPVGSESCFFVDGVGIGDSLELAFVALDGFGGGGRRERGIRVNVTASNGQILLDRPVSFSQTVKDKATAAGEYEVCFDNRGSWSDASLYWSVVVEGKLDHSAFAQKLEDSERRRFNRTTLEFMNRLEEVMMGRNMFHGVRYQWLTKAHNTKEIHKAEALLNMVDTWSLLHAGLIVLLSLGQVFVLRRLFEVPFPGREVPRRFQVTERAC